MIEILDVVIVDLDARGVEIGCPFLFRRRTSEHVQGLSEPRSRAVPTRWNLTAGRALKPIVIRGVLAMTEIDWTVVGSALLLVGWLASCSYCSTSPPPPCPLSCPARTQRS
jgi:hypothetical protein